MALEMKFGLLCDYVTLGAGNKPIALHIFDHFNRLQGMEQQPFQSFFVLARFNASIADGTTHQFSCAIVDEDEQVIRQWDLPPIMFQSAGPGLPLIGQVISQVNGMVLPVDGNYAYRIASAGKEIGRINFRVLRVIVPQLPG